MAGMVTKKRHRSSSESGEGLHGDKLAEGDEDKAAAIAGKEDDDSSEDENDVGPLPVAGESTKGAAKKKQRVLHHEALYLESLPDQDMYERSLMHRDMVNFVLVTQ
jgi:peptidylprolyl isomerase domain and WD repeat-containing protein 1